MTIPHLTARAAARLTAQPEPHRGRRWRIAASIALIAALTGIVLFGHRGWADINDPLVRFLVAVMIVLLVCNVFAAVAKRIRQPRVVMEIIAGIALGPSLLGAISPGTAKWIFTPAVSSAMGMAAQLGLVIFMFLLGLELTTEATGQRSRTLSLIVAGSLGLPFLAGIVVTLCTGTILTGTANHAASVSFLGIALAITAVPVLARILVDLRIEGSVAGRLSLAAAAIGDGFAWIGLTLILAVAGATSSEAALTSAAAAAGFVLGTLLWVRPLLAKALARLKNSSVVVPAVVAIMLGFAAISQLVGLHVVVGAFLFGVVMPRDHELLQRMNQEIRMFSVTLLLPLFFAGIGMTTSIALLAATPMHLVAFLAVIVAAISTKLVGAGGAAWMAGLPRHDALRVGSLMNCRGVTELVVASIGYKFGLISHFGFTVLVLTALITTLSTAPLIRVLNRQAVRGGMEH